MEETANLHLPYIMPSQAQKHVTHNEALRMLDAVVQLAIADRDLAAPPTAPVDGARYIVAAAATDLWSGKSGQIAAWQDGAWAFYVPEPGWTAWIGDEAVLLVFNGADWVAPSSVNPAPLVGVNTKADAANRLSVKADAALFSADDVTPGTGDMRIALNKAAAANTGSLIFQTGFSGRAEFGLAGDDDLHVKVSPNGTSFKSGLIVGKDDGRAKFPQGIAHPATGALVSQLLPAPVVAEIWRIDTPRRATPRTYAVAAASGVTVTLATAAAAEIFTDSMRNVAMVRIWNISKSPAASAWVTWNASATQLSVSNAADIANWAAGETVQLGDPNPAGPDVLNMVAIDISNFLQNNFGAVFPQTGVLLATYASGQGGDVSLDCSGNGAAGSATGTASLSNGGRNYGAVTLFTPVLSPISNSNLVFLRETLGAGSMLGTCFARLQGLYV